MDDFGCSDNFTSLRLLRTMFAEYRLCGWHIVSSNLSNQRLMVDFKFHTGQKNSIDQHSLGPSTLFCMQIVKQLYTYLKIRQWTIVSGDRETEIIHFSFTFEFKKDISRLPSNCLKSIVSNTKNRLSKRDQPSKSRPNHEGDDTFLQLMNIMRDLERTNNSNRSRMKSSTSGALTEDGDSLMAATPPMRQRTSAWFENESESDTNEQRLNEELANWRMGVCLRSSPYDCSSSVSASTSISCRSRSAIRRPVPRRIVDTDFQSIATSPKPPATSDSKLINPISLGNPNGRSKSAAPSKKYTTRRHETNFDGESLEWDSVEACFLRKPVVGEGELVGKRKNSGQISDGSKNSLIKINATDGGQSSISSCSIRQYSNEDSGKTEPNVQCSMCKRKIDSFSNRQCDHCFYYFCTECVWWCVLAKSQRCLMCYSASNEETF